jgi:isoleucyl-tRNA synthetase
MFEPVSPQVSFPSIDEKWLSFWDEASIFEKTMMGREDAPPFVFYEGPPTANGMPHPGHVLTRVMKDLFLRYRTMCGYSVPRRAGWDTHGLPVEVEVEKALGISGRGAIEEYGVEAFSKLCIESVFKYIDEWRKMTRRIGFWVDLDDAYVTFHKSYVESVWWALKSLYDKGLLYQGYKIVWWWPQGGTALSSGEVGQGYKQVDDPSVFVRFGVVGRENTSFVAWTTTPWTLPSNVALAVSEKVDYAFARMPSGETLIVAEALASKVLGDDAEVVQVKKGGELVGMRYQPPFSYQTPEGGDHHLVVAGDFVTLDSGTGLVHLAPAFGEDDFRVCRELGLGFLQLVEPDGKFAASVTDFAGRFCKDADRDIIRDLKRRGLLLKEEVYRHDYPFCWRRDTDPLIQYARRSWFIRTTAEIEKVKENNKSIHWEPEHIKSGRMGQFLEGNVDWALSRERFWGTPLPIWVNDETGAMESIGSVQEILDRNPSAFAAFDEAKSKDPSLSEDLRVHKPWIDDVTYTKMGEPGTYRRVPEVIDCWFDSGCMPFAQWGYPHSNADAFHRNFPADFITEAVDQTRGWFYSLMTISTLLFGEEALPHPFKNCVVLGLMTDEEGKKLSKSKKNYSDPLELMESSGADAVRWALYTGTVPGQSTRFFDRAASDAIREFLLKIWNVYSFFVTYANIEKWDARATRVTVKERPALDRYILAELDSTVRKVRAELDVYKSHQAVKHLEEFVDALSNWYVRRSRGRFWSSEESADKSAAYATLYEVLVDLSKLSAPFVPFVAESLYQNLVRGADASAPESVHLAAYPEPMDERADEALREAVEEVRRAVTLGQRVRNEAKLKVRQPLAEAVIVVASEAERERLTPFIPEIRDELNVEQVGFTSDPSRYVDFTLLPNFRALGPKLGKLIPACKKVLGEADGASLYAEMAERGEVTITVEGQAVTLNGDEIEVRLSAKQDFAAASQGGHVVVLDTRLTPELVRAGLAREALSRIQRARKERDLPFDARIAVTYEAGGELGRALEEHAAYVAGESLAERFEPGTVSTGGAEETVEGERFAFTLEVLH